MVDGGKNFFLLCLAVVGAPAALATAEAGVPTYRVGDVRNCPVKSPQDDSQPLYQMEVLPGVGFDNLRNLDMGQVHAYNFSNCQVSKDGKFLLPDSMFLLPVQESKVNVYAEYFDHWDNYTSATSNSMNLDVGFFSVVSGKFSAGYSMTKSHMHNDNAKSTRVQIRNKLYTVKLQPGSELHPTFKSRLYDIASSIQNNNTEYAQYLSELLVRDYGTHYVSSMDAGAILSQTDFIRSTDVTDMFKYSSYIKASASANFFGKVKLGAAFSHGSSQSDTTAFVNNRTFSQVTTIGGPPFMPNMTLDQWEKGVPNALVAIDRSGDPLHFVVNPTTLPRLPETTVRLLANHVRHAINRYYKVNTRHGCTNPNAANFDFQANLDDSHCSPPNTNFTFGGVYQSCTVDSTHQTEDLCTGGPSPALQKNPLTGDLSCPPGYSAIHLHSGTVSHVTQKPVCNNVCHHCGFLGLSHCCHCESVLTPFLSLAKYDAYWCAALPGTPIPENDGYLFGGYYTSKASNPVTGSMTCPRFYYPLHLGEDIEICVSSDYTRGFAYNVDFGGLESCTMGNPLADSNPNDNSPANWPHTCPHGYAQHLVAVEDSCEINFCVRAGALRSSKLLAPRLPPFRKHPKYKKNVTDTLVVFGVYGEVWVKNEEGGWNEVSGDSDSGQELLKKINSEFSTNSNGDSHLSGGGVAGVSVVGTIVLCTLVAVVVIFAGRLAYKRRKSKSKDQRGYMTINDEQAPSTARVSTEPPKLDENTSLPV